MKAAALPPPVVAAGGRSHRRRLRRRTSQEGRDARLRGIEGTTISDSLHPLLRMKRPRPSPAGTLSDNHPHGVPTPCAGPSGYAPSSGSCLPTSAGSHLVQFYDDETHLYGVLSDFYAPFLRADGDGALAGVVLARLRTTRHLRDCLVLQGYQQHGIDGGGIMSQVGAVYRRGEKRVFLLDADKVLARLVRESELDGNAFQDLAAEFSSQVLVSLPPSSMDTPLPGQSSPPVYTYGELVDILCARGQHHLALELEGQWNRFIKENNILLLCGYKMDSFRGSLVENVFNQICHSHTTVTPTESYSRLATQDQKLTMVATLQQKVRAASEERRPKYWSAGNTAESAEQQIRRREQFVETMCHELRNPVSAIVGNVDILQMGLEMRRSTLDRVEENGRLIPQADVLALRVQLTEDFHSMETITVCAEHMRALSDNVLSLSKLEDGKVILQSLPFDPKSSIVAAVKMFTVAARKKGIELRHNLPPDDICVLGDQCRFAQVIINLISNAIKFTDTGGITIHLQKLKPEPPPPTPYSSDSDNYPTAGAPSIFEVAVCDTGRGLSKDERAVLFQRFAQPISTNYTKYGGSGLGLYISKYIVELMGGELRVESEPSVGSTFVFTFQALEHRGLKGHHSPQPPIKGSTASRNLVAEVAPFPPPTHRDNRMSIDTNNSSKIPSLVIPSSNPTRSNSIVTDQIKQSISHMPHVLLIDDDPIILRTISRMLALSYPFPITISTATNGYEGISKLISASKNGSPVSLVIMDLHMPYLGGIEATRLIRALPAMSDEETSGGRRNISDVIILGFSGDGNEETFETARAAGMDECLGKPVPRKVLLEVIEKVTEQRKGRLSPEQLRLAEGDSRKS
jgi:signal transduction histidine kinase/CheY-like chemotaxis protein